MVTALKPSLRQLIWNSNSSLHVKVDANEDLLNTYHYHPEIELILLKRSAGLRIIGSSIENFAHNDIVLIGKNLPHAFLHEEQYLEKNQPYAAEAVVIQFNESFMGNEFLNLPELREIKSLFSFAQQGLCITDRCKHKIIPLIDRMLEAASLDRILLLLEILKIMINKDTYRALVSEKQFYQADLDKRINKVLDFTFENFDQNIKIEEVAKMINMTKESFCRYFKAKTRKTYLEFLIEFRICKACRMIMENELSIKEISYSCGFDSMSNFHHQFKKIIKQSPLEYKCQYIMPVYLSA
jgi:AraC-like DNA-binding protein